MPIRMLFLLLLFGLGPVVCTAQLSRTDTVLFLHFDAAKYYKVPLYIRVAKGEKPKLRITYSYGSIYFLYDGLPLEFGTELGPKPDTVKARKLRNVKIATHEQLADFIEANYPMNQTSKYFLQLKSIYLVEPTKKKGYVTVTKVELNIDIE
ncbi:hypothetical protein [Chryseolinea lacunae]|uniref:Uncharacterized protein n=1 Tax=Chryseolinea lacunae TaxID=2801331 RepID=A0ABS1KL48_9BACT|nr:hypothetical protein [Chryseolinea lacunae]MBL0739952.1 hypothetical protein [Chryseolinea lacunae]